MIGCVPEIIPVKITNPDSKYDTTKSIEEAEEIVETVKKNNRRSRRSSNRK